jgi:uncharacterized membrane protein
MLPDPLHPAIVHLPIALVILIPIFAFGALWAIHRGAAVRKVWGLPVGLMVLLVASAWLALETGEREEEAVEAVVAESAIESHEEAAERFLFVGATVLVLISVGLLSGRLGGVARWTGAAGTLLLLAAGVQVGHLGGELVYRHGAAAAYVDSTPGGDEMSGDGERRERRDDDDRH